MLVALPMPSQRGHMPPVTVKLRCSLTFCPARSVVIAPAPETDATLNENAWGEPRCGCPTRLNRMRRSAFASVAVPTVERTFAPIRSWSTMIAVVSPSSTSTSGRARVGMNPWTKLLYVSLIMRWDSAAIVPKTSELLPEPDTPVKTVSLRLGSSTLMSLRLFSRAPCTRITSWLSASVTCEILPRRSDAGAARQPSPDGSADPETSAIVELSITYRGGRAVPDYGHDLVFGSFLTPSAHDPHRVVEL